MMMYTILFVAILAQIPNPTPAINAAKDARAKTEAAQKKNSEALDPQVPKPAAPAPAPPEVAKETPAAPPPPAAQGTTGGAAYSYDPNGRRDPFVSLTARGGDVPFTGSRPAGAAGLLVNEVTVKGLLKSPKGGLIALVQAPDGKTFILHSGDKVLDGTVKAVTQDAIVFSQDVSDPLSLVKQREVRKSIRPEAR
jgi:hypothetical protein